MREFMTIVESQGLTEAWDDFEILENPSRSRVRGFVSRALARRPAFEKEGRAAAIKQGWDFDEEIAIDQDDMVLRGNLYRSGNVYIIDAFQGTHSQLINNLDESGAEKGDCSPVSMFYITSTMNLVSLVPKSIPPALKALAEKWGCGVSLRGAVSEDASEDEPEVPPVLYHGTTPYNAALIVLSGKIEQNESRDEDDHNDYSVCTTEREDVAEWFYDVARAVDQPFGFVFHIDTANISDHMRPFEGETASQDEYEWRVYGDIPASAITKVTLAGYEPMSKGEIRKYVEQMQREYRYYGSNAGSDQIVNAIMSLIKKCS
jgi:hypothetical protein